ncbi:hypothetical protein [Burkholderia aenigmatica]|uniref:hypothetical protein n=1 Tax=Burkholderia aenigmatica TaxID=2015348 RepID=UPI002659F596|nr:hypothetical protein [Burkholderia aenigmatica]
MMTGVASQARAGPANGESGAASTRLPAGLVVAAHLVGMAAGIAAIAVLATLLALLFR